MGHKYRLSEVEKQDFVKCWNEDMACERMQTRFAKSSVDAVKVYAVHLRKEGYSLKYRGKENESLKFPVIESQRMTGVDKKPTSKHPWKRRSYQPKVATT